MVVNEFFQEVQIILNKHSKIYLYKFTIYILSDFL